MQFPAGFDHELGHSLTKHAKLLDNLLGVPLIWLELPHVWGFPVIAMLKAQGALVLYVVFLVFSCP